MGIGNRTKNAFVGVLFGFLMVPGSICLHAWNEYRTVHRARGLNEAEKVVVTIGDIDRVDASLESKLVHLTGLATTEEILSDQQFGVSEQAIRLKRVVEMYQWDETEHKDDDRTTYSYSKGWYEGRINSNSFHDAGYDNPQPAYDSEDTMADMVHVGAYQLPQDLLRSMKRWASIKPNQAAIQETAGNEVGGSFEVSGEWAYWSKQTPEPTDPEVGDLRIGFQMIPPGDVSLMARLTNNSFSAFKTSNGESIKCLYDGSLTKEEVVDRQRTENTIMAWILRAVGFALCFGGFQLLLGPLQAMVGWIPILGDLTRGAIFIVALLLAVMVSSVTIAVAWIAVRPLLGIALLAIAVACIVALFKFRGKKEEGILQEQTPPPVVNDSMFVD